MVLKSHRESAPGYASVPSTLCRFSIVSTLPLSAAFHESGRRPDPTSGCWREQGGGITTRRQPITSVRRAPHSPADGRLPGVTTCSSNACGAASSTRKRDEMTFHVMRPAVRYPGGRCLPLVIVLMRLCLGLDLRRCVQG